MSGLATNTKHKFWQKRRFGDERDFILASGPVAVVTGLQHALRDTMLRRLQRLLAGRLPVRRLVDVGCAIGDWTLAYACNGFAVEVVGLELNTGFLAIARERAGLAGGDAARVRFVEGDANTSEEVVGADIVCMGGFIQYLTSAEATALLERVAATQAPGGVLYVRTSCPPSGGRGVPDDYYRPRTWYEPLFARLGYRVLDTEVSAAIVARSYAAFLGPGSRVIGRFAAWLHTRVIQRGKLEFVNWVLEREGTPERQA